MMTMMRNLFDRNEGLHSVATPDAEYATKQIGETVNRAMAALPEDVCAWRSRYAKLRV